MNENWNVSYTWHTHDEKWHIATTIIEAESIGLALNEIATILDDKMERENWSDYCVTGINVIPELH